MTTTTDLVKVLQESRDKQTIVLKFDCGQFWTDFVHDIYCNREIELLKLDTVLKENLMMFRELDSLELVSKKGKLLKRFARFYKEQTGNKLTDNVMGILGDRLQYFVTNSVNGFTLDFTDKFDWNDGQFGKSGSCYWGQYSESIPTLEDGGAWAIRFYRDMDDTYGTGRTWILPKDDALFCFNSYGVERPTTSKSIKSVFLEKGIVLHYKAIELYNSNHNDIPYINSGTGFVLYPEGINVDEFGERYDIDLFVQEDESKTTCNWCGDRFDLDDEGRIIDDECYCDDCVSNHFSFCDKCEEYYSNDYCHSISGHARYSVLCQNCLERVGAVECSNCEVYTCDYVITNDTDEVFCDDCASEHTYYCDICNETFENESACPNCESEDQEDSESGDTESTGTEAISVPEIPEMDFISGNLETITVYGEYGTFTTMVYRHDNVPGLYVFYDKDFNAYSLTHESSGLRLCDFIPEHYKVFELLGRLQGIIDWTQSQDVVLNSRDEINRVQDIIREVV